MDEAKVIRDFSKPTVEQQRFLAQSIFDWLASLSEEELAEVLEEAGVARVQRLQG